MNPSIMWPCGVTTTLIEPMRRGTVSRFRLAIRVPPLPRSPGAWWPEAESRWKEALCHQFLTEQYAKEVVHFEGSHGRPSDRRAADDSRAFPAEVSPPLVAPRIEE